jgi:hypothetical protein
MLWMYQMAENKVVTGAVPQEDSFFSLFPSRWKVSRPSSQEIGVGHFDGHGNLSCAVG